MAKRIVWIVVLAIAAAVAYLSYQRYDARRAGANGYVYSSDPATGGRRISSDPDEDQQNNSANASDNRNRNTVAPNMQTAAPPVSTGMQRTAQAATASPAPATDTINPNPPNGMVFSGTGKYQLYRQGNITWRLNTDTGQSCILFATDAEWKKPRVYRAGCGNR